MAASDLLAGTVMDISAALLNDPNRTVYTYAAQLPYLQLALQELQEYYQEHNIPTTQDSSAIINMEAGDTQIVYNGGSTPSLPDDMVEPQSLYESPEGENSWILMTKKQYIPHTLESLPVNMFRIYSWNGQEIRVPAASTDIDIKIDYLKELFTEIENESSIINVINARTFLQYRTASLCAEFNERNTTSSESLGAYAQMGIERAAGIAIKRGQNIYTRRRPFRAGYKSRGWTI